MTERRETLALALASRLLDPEDLGFTADPHIRDAARQVLGYAPVETVRRPRTDRAALRAERNAIPPAPPPPATRYIRDDRNPEPKKAPGQTRRGSLIESLANVAVGAGVALASQLVIFPLYDIHVSMTTNIYIMAWFTGISIARSYVIRRWFNGFKGKA